MRNVPTAVAFREETLDALDRAAKERGLTRSAAVAEAVTRYLEDGEAPPPSPPRHSPGEGARYQTNVRLDPELARAASEYGATHGVARQTVIRAAVVRWLERLGIEVDE